MLFCCAFKINPACSRTSVFSFAIRSRDIHFDKHNFLLKSAFIARHETRNFTLSLDMLNDYVNGAVRDCAIIIWRGGGGSKINRGGLNLNQSAG